MPKKTGSATVVSMSVGVGLAVGLYGTSFGALSAASGLTIWQTQVLSLLMFSGGSQFAMIGVLGVSGPAGIVPAIISAWLLGIRNGFYALRLNSVLSVTGLTKALAAQLTIDESNAVSASQDNPKDSKLGFWLTGAAVFVFWNSFTLLGAVVGSRLGSPSVWGLDAAAAAAFLGLVWPRLHNLQNNLIALLAVGLTLVLVPQLPSGIPVIVAAPVAVGLIYLLKRTPAKKYLKAGTDA
jgi:predicted branched-subunit amino acid permease